MSENQKASIGRIVHYFPNDYEKPNAGDDVVAGIIVGVHGDRINLKLFADNDMGTWWKTSVLQRKTSDQRGVWDWPARV